MVRTLKVFWNWTLSFWNCFFRATKLYKNTKISNLIKNSLIKWSNLSLTYVKFLIFSHVIDQSKNKTLIREKNSFKNQIKIYKNLHKNNKMIQKIKSLYQIITITILILVWKLKKSLNLCKKILWLKRRKMLNWWKC